MPIKKLREPPSEETVREINAIGLNEYTKFLAKQGLSVSPSSLSRWLRRHGYISRPHYSRLSELGSATCVSPDQARLPGIEDVETGGDEMSSKYSAKVRRKKAMDERRTCPYCDSECVEYVGVDDTGWNLADIWHCCDCAADWEGCTLSHLDPDECSGLKEKTPPVRKSGSTSEHKH